jgi:two-component system, response regulator YesN
MHSATDYLNKTNKDSFNALMRQLSKKSSECFPERSAISKENKGVISFKTEQELFHFLESKDFSSAMKLITHIYISSVGSNVGDTANLTKLNLHLILLIYRILEQFDINPESLLGDEFLLCSELNSLNKIEAITEWYKLKLDSCFEAINDKKEKGNRKLIDKAKIFIKENISSDITLESVSEYVHMSPSYFSKVFKDETGDKFVNYVNVQRVELSKNLLKQGIYKAKEVGEMVGIYNTKYFYKVFKKITGLTPSQYKDI